MRDYCLDCVIKHLGQAFVTQTESQMGYDAHILLTIGHLAEASEECVEIDSSLAEEIRQHRLMVMADNLYKLPYFELYNKVQRLIDEKGCGNCKKAKNAFQQRIAAKKAETSEDKSK